MKKAAFSCLTLILLIQACRKDAIRQQTPGQADTTSFTLTAAQLWFNAQPRQPIITKTPSSTTIFSLGGLTVFWEKAASYQGRSGNFWVAGTNGQPRQGKYTTGYRKIALIKDKTGTISARILEIIPDGNYLQRKQKASAADFTGRLFIYDQGYYFLGGRIYINGKIAGEIKPKNKTSTDSNLHTDNLKTIYDCQWVDDNYINSEGEVVIYSERVCTATTIDTGNPFDDGGTAGYVGDDSGGTNGTAAAPPVSNLPGESGPAVDPKSLMKCFGNVPDAGAKMTVTLYVVEPFPGTTFNIGPNSVGHTAIGLTKTNGSQSVTQVVGYYPNATGFAKLHAPSKIVDNGGDLNYDVSISFTVTADNFKKVLNYISDPPTTYDLITFNCTDFAYFACDAGGITIPSPWNDFGVSVTGKPLQRGMSPAGLGKSIENMKGQSNVNTTGGTTPFGKGPCS